MFIINKHYEATESNPNFKEAIKDFYYGKGGHTIGRENEFPCLWEIENYGYKTLAAAKKALNAAQELCDWENERGFWRVSVSLLQVQ